MPLISLVVVLIVVGFLLYLVNRLIPMEPTIKQVLNVVVILVTVLWVLSAFGLFNHLGTIRVGR